MIRPIYTLWRVIFRRDKATTGTQCPTNEYKRNQSSEDSLMIQQAHSVPAELTRNELNRFDGWFADSHPKSAIYVTNEDGGISNTSIHEVAVTTTCIEFDEDD